MTTKRWYVNPSHIKVTLAVGPAPTDILLITQVGTDRPSLQLWKRAGDVVSATDASAANAVQDSGALPSDHLPPPPAPPLTPGGAAATEAELAAETTRASAAETARVGLAFYDVVGNSIPAGGGVTSGDWNGYVDKLMFLLGTPRRKRNLAVGGAVSCRRNRNLTGDGGFGHVLQFLSTAPTVAAGGPFLPQADLSVMHMALNDLAALGQNKPLPMQEAHRTILARLAAAAVARVDDTTLAFTGTWTAGNLGGLNTGPQGYKSSATVGDKVTWAIPVISQDGGTRTVGFTVLVRPGDDLTLGIKIDGVAQPDVRVLASAVCDPNGYNAPGVAEWNALTRRYAVNAAVAHSLEVTLKTQTVAGSNIFFDSAYIESDANDGQTIVVPNVHRCVTYALWGAPWAFGSSMSDAAVAVWNTALATVVAEFPHALLVDIDSALHKDQGYFYPSLTSDGAHPNDVGHAVIASTIYGALLASGKLSPARVSRVSPTLGQYWQLLGGFSGAPALANGWIPYGAPYSTPGFYKDLSGRVHLKGTIKGGTAANAAIFTLPAGYRPTETRLFVQSSGTAATQVQVTPAGVVNVPNGGSTAIQILDGINFLAEQ